MGFTLSLQGMGTQPCPAGLLRNAQARELWTLRLVKLRAPQEGCGRAPASGPSALPSEDLLSELVSSGILPLAQEIKARFTSSLVSIVVPPTPGLTPTSQPDPDGTESRARTKVYVEATWTVCSS